MQLKPVLALLVVVGVLFFSLGGIPSAARKQRPDEPASEGRPITPAGSLVQDLNTRQPAVGAMPVDFVRSPDTDGPGGQGRYLLGINSGFGIQFSASGNRGQQSISVIDLNAKPSPAVVQNVYFPSPQSANVGMVFSKIRNDDGTFPLYVSGGFENKIWIFNFSPSRRNPVTPESAGPNTNVEAPFIDVTGFTTAANTPRYNNDKAPVYPTGIDLSGDTLFVANNLADNVGIIRNVRQDRKLDRIDLRRPTNKDHAVYPYDVLAYSRTRSAEAAKVYVSLWNDSSIAVVNLERSTVSYIPVGMHPTAIIANPESTRLYVANSNGDSVSVIDTQSDREIERINARLSEDVPPGNSPEGLALAGDDLYIANAHSNSIAVVELSPLAQGANINRPPRIEEDDEEEEEEEEHSQVRGFIPTGQYPSAIAVAGRTIFVGNGKGTGLENSSVVVNNSGRVPNIPNDRFPAGSGRGSGAGGQYSASLVIGNISAIPVPDDPSLSRFTQQVMRNNGLLGPSPSRLFAGKSPIKHVIYVIKENRTYDQVFGDVEKSGDGSRADGDPALAIFGGSDAAARPNGTRQDITPNHRALALRFGLLDRFFVNSEASPDGHNWSTAAFSTDYVDKAYRWNYSRRGRTYDFEGFNRLPNYEPLRGSPSMFGPRASKEDVESFLRRYIPYLQGSRDVAEPQTLYLWDAAARAGLTYRNYGEFVATLSEFDVKAVRDNKSKSYPDLSPTVSAFPTKKSLEGRFSKSYRNFDMDTPDSMTIESYRDAKDSNANALISEQHADERFRGNSRLGVWLDEFRGFVANRAAGKGDQLPNLSIVRLSNDHTEGLSAGKPTPQFYVADNDYGVGLMIDAVSHSEYWKDTAILVVEDDAQDGPDHVDAHRSVALVISAYNRPGALVHEFHNTVSLIRTLELLLGLPPMNQLDATANPIDVFSSTPDLRPYNVVLPNVAPDNLVTPASRDAATAHWMKLTSEQDLVHADMADPEVLNQIIWFSVKGSVAMPAIARLPAFEAMRLGLLEEREEVATRGKRDRD